MSKRRLLNPVTTYLHLSALLPSITIRMAALSALFHLCGYYLSLLLRRACLLVSSMITFIAPSAMLPQPDLLLSSRLLLRPPRLGGGWSLVRSRLSYLPLIPTYSMLVVERARLYPGVMIPFPRPIRKRAGPIPANVSAARTHQANKQDSEATAFLVAYAQLYDAFKQRIS